MRRTRARSRSGAAALALSAAVGFAAGWILRGHPPEPVRSTAGDRQLSSLVRTPQQPRGPQRTASSGSSSNSPVATAGRGNSALVEELREKNLRVPIDGANVAQWKGQFDEPRDAGGRPHEAVDILAPRNTPIHAVDDGSIAKLFFSHGGGGNTIYQFDPSGRFCYYYAHVERYAEGVRDGQHVSRGDVIGYVGTSGNAPRNTPHLHFAVFVLGAEHEWWKGQPIDPYLLFAH